MSSPKVNDAASKADDVSSKSDDTSTNDAGESVTIVKETNQNV